MKTRHKTWTQIIPISLEEAWNYFSRPEHLNEITPSNFKIKLQDDISEIELHKGMEINYSLIPVLNIPMKWTTRITDLEKPNFFVYEQKKGPYAQWIHEHYFEEIKGGVKMTDKLSYALSWGFLGQWLNNWLIEKRINQIFETRADIIRSKFGTPQ